MAHISPHRPGQVNNLAYKISLQQSAGGSQQELMMDRKYCLLFADGR